MKVRVEVTDDAGMKSSIEKEGVIQLGMLKRDVINEVLRFLEEKLSLIPIQDVRDPYIEGLTIKERLASFLQYDPHAPPDWFTSSQIQQIYEENFDESVRLSTISTYLANLHTGGILAWKGSRAKRQFKVLRAQEPVEAESNAMAVESNPKISPEYPSQSVLSKSDLI
jgi:hypothetical protein